MNKYYFELSKVESITLYMERECTEYYWKEEVPARPKKFLGFAVGKYPPVPAGWSDYEEEDEYDYRKRKQKSYFDQYSWYRADEVTKKIFHKPQVEVVLGYKHSISTRFESDAEAQAWVDELIATSDKKFHVIVKK